MLQTHMDRQIYIPSSRDAKTHPKILLRTDLHIYITHKQHADMHDLNDRFLFAKFGTKLCVFIVEFSQDHNMLIMVYKKTRPDTHQPQSHVSGQRLYLR